MDKQAYIMSAYTPIIKIFKNRSGGELIVSGVVVDNGADFIIPKSQWAKLADTADLWAPLIDSQDVLINDGTGDLVPSDALSYLKILAFGGETSFSYNEVTSEATLIIPIRQQMIVYQQIEIDGTLELVGDLIVID
jgi:hypothetical protein